MRCYFGQGGSSCICKQSDLGALLILEFSAFGRVRVLSDRADAGKWRGIQSEPPVQGFD
jgi:hypothetical protein